MDPKSTAYIPFDSGAYYVQGCINGGTSAAYLKLCDECSKNIHTDLDNGIVAVWHDESHLNKYILNKNSLILGCNYLWPENFSASRPNDVKIIQRDKTNPIYGGIRWLRGETDIREHAYDIVICCADKDFGTLGKTIKYLTRNATYRNIIIISNRCPECIGGKIKYVSEADVMDGLNYDAVRDYFVSRGIEPSRVGWYLQQFIKMAFAYKTDLKNYLVWDADTLMLNPIQFFDDAGRMLYDNSRIWADDVFNKTVRAILGYPRDCAETYIVEHMMMDTECIRDLIKTIAGDRPVHDFWKIILDKISDDDLIYGGFSEFETIGTFMNKKYHDKIALRKLRSNRNATNIVGNKPNKYDIRALTNKYDFVSFEKSHKIQTSRFTILKNKIRNLFIRRTKTRKKIAILYIVTGRYTAFWNDFYKTCEKYFLPDHDKHYFVFTDAEKLKYEENNNITKIYQKKLDWPYAVLEKYRMFLSIKETLKDYDYVIVFNANTKFLKKVGEEFLPTM